MAYGMYSSFGKVCQAVRAGVCKVAVNHFRPYQLANAVTSSVLAAKALYYQKSLVPLAACLLLGRFAFSLEILPVVGCALGIGAISYLLDVRRGFVLIGLICIAVGLTVENNLLSLVGICLALAFACAYLWWEGISRIVSAEVLEDKARFDSLWSEGLIVLVGNDSVWSVEGRSELKNMAENVEAYASVHKDHEGDEQ